MIKEHSFHSFGTVLGSFMSKMASFDRLVKKAADPAVQPPGTAAGAPQIPAGAPDYRKAFVSKNNEYYYPQHDPATNGASVGTVGDFGRYLIDPTGNHNLGAQNSYWRWLDNRSQDQLKDQPAIVRQSVVPVREAAVEMVNSRRKPGDPHNPQVTAMQAGYELLDGNDDASNVTKDDLRDLRLQQAREGAARIYGRGTPAYYDAIPRYVHAGRTNHEFWKATQGDPARQETPGETLMEPEYLEPTYGTPEQKAADRAQMKGMAYNNRRPRTAVPA